VGSSGPADAAATGAASTGAGAGAGAAATWGGHRMQHWDRRGREKNPIAVKSEGVKQQRIV